MFLVCSCKVINQYTIIVPSRKESPMRNSLRKRPYRSQAMFAHAYVLAISSSALRFVILLRDCASNELASSMSSGGRGPERRGMISLRAFSTGLLILSYVMY